MKVKAINRSEEACTRERSSDLRKVPFYGLLRSPSTPDMQH
jgi:hypothetical protein